MNESDSVEIIRGTVVTMNAAREIISDGAVAMSGGTIVDVGSFDGVGTTHPGTHVRGSSSDLILPGYINGHQHLTGDRLIQSSVPDDLAPGESIFTWVVPVHDVHTGDDDQLSATLTLAESLTHGVTSTFEAGTVAHPGRIAAAARDIGARLTIGTWGWDVDEGPYAGPVDEVIDRQIASLDVDAGPLVSSWVSLVGHDLMSDELVVAASDLARGREVGMTFHLSPHTGDPASYLERTGKRPLVHLRDLGALGPHVAIAHGVHLDDAELDVLAETRSAVVSCPWAYLRLGQGVTNEFRHLDIWKRGGRLALGCDSENAGDMVDGLRAAALFAGLAKDVPTDPTVFGAHDALELLTIKGAEALGVADSVGSIEVGKQADLVVHDRTQTEWIPNSPDPVLQLVWGSDGRSVRDVWVAGNQVVKNGSVTTIDVQALTNDAVAAGSALRTRAGIPAPSRWPVR
ncbi:MAG: amidohydrolase family protein [Acidimicrobiia bacterium]|nr:amidohydrolase family protein [Acidimicrobiia bacterium]